MFPLCALRFHSASSPTLVVRAILLCFSATVPSASYRLTHRSFLRLPGSYLLDSVSKRFPSPVWSLQSFSLGWKRKLSTLFRCYRSSTVQFAAICPLTSSSLVIVLFCFEILDLEVSSPLTKPVECFTTATVPPEHAVLVALAKTWSCTPFILLISLTMLLRTDVLELIAPL